MPRFEFSSVIDAPVETVFAFHERPEALELLTPPDQPVKVLRREGGILPGGIVELEVGFGPIRQRWLARHTEYQRNVVFVDVQDSGPFRRWVHRHEFHALGGSQTQLRDAIEFSLPLAPLSDWLFAWVARLQLKRMFAHRHKVTKAACEQRA